MLIKALLLLFIIFVVLQERIVAGLTALARRGVLVRDKSQDPACPGCVRITAGPVEHTRACIAALEEVLCGGA